MKLSMTLLIMFALCLSSFTSEAADFYYTILQWPESVFAAKGSRCPSKSVTPPADFTIAGLVPSFLNATIPSNCNPKSHFSISKIADLVPGLEANWPSLACPRRHTKTLWSRNWQQYGTCTMLDQHQYFKAALNIKTKITVLSVLKNAGIQPNGNFYSCNDIYSAIEGAIYSPGLECNRDKSGNFQLYKVHLCTDGYRLIDCPGMPEFNCPAKIKFPSHLEGKL